MDYFLKLESVSILDLIVKVWMIFLLHIVMKIIQSLLTLNLLLKIMRFTKYCYSIGVMLIFFNK